MATDSAALPTTTPDTEPPRPTDVDMESVRRAELDIVFGRASIVPPRGAAADPDDETAWGVALSGGGIRSATFGLGVLQALARRGLLPGFHYQSTVSGGGYIGAFVQGLIHRHSIEDAVKALSSSVTDPAQGNVQRPAAAPAQGAGGAAEKDAPPKNFDPRRPIRHLREYSNYLSPRKSALSGDTMGMLGNYVRNVLLIQVQLLALIAAACLVPLFLFPAFVVLREHPFQALLLTGVLCVAAGVTVNQITSRAQSPAGAKPAPRGARPEPAVTRSALRVTVLLGLATLTGAAGIACVGANRWPLALVAAVLYFGVWMLWLARDGRISTDSPMQRNSLRFVLASFGSALVAALALVGAQRLLETIKGAGLVVDDWHLVLFGPTIVLMSIMLAGIAHVGFAGKALTDLQREIWARIGGRAARLVVLGSAALALTVYGPWLLLKLGTLGWAAALSWLATTGVGVFGAFSKRSSGGQSSLPLLEIVVRVAPPIFVVGLLMAVSLGAQVLLQHTGFGFAWDPPAGIGDSTSYLTYLGANAFDKLPAVLLVFVVAALISLLFGLTIDVNEFSMNAFYRNRLVRCYLGASRERDPEPTTNFDPDDDINLHDLVREPATGADTSKISTRPLYPLIGTALNLAATRQLDWQDRKAASFCLTPRHCGYIPPASRWQARSIGDQPPREGGAAGLSLAQALSLGSATAISGAAVSPNMGYHSSPAVTFLLTVFDARLGWWLANPHHDSHPRADSTPSSLYRIVREMLGLTRDDDDFVYLSDGGHFENLGLYELVRRRCRFIVCVDAGADRARNFADLGNAVQKCRVDFGANIDIDVSALRPGPDGRSERACAVGTIAYTNGKTGTILYLKPSLTGAEPPDVAHYASAHRSFPHESTADQYFDEKQFESYRRLGEHVADLAVAPALERAQRAQGGASFDVDASPVKENFLVELYHQWVTPLAGVRDNFATHGKAMASLFEKIRMTKELAVLDAQIYPAWTDLVPGDGKPGNLPFDRRTTLPAGDDFRACFYFCQELMQLMESVYHDLALEQFWSHPDNRGWMNIFRYWSWSPMFRIAWGASSPTYGSRFATFCETRLGLPALDDLVGLEIRAVKADGADNWPALCARLADAGEINHVERSMLESPALAVAADGGGYQLVLLRLRWANLLAGTRKTPGDSTFGIALVRCVEDGDVTRAVVPLVRVQDHLRRLGLGAVFLRQIVAKYDEVDIVVPAGDYRLGGFLTLDAADVLGKQLARLRELALQHRRAASARSSS